MFDLLFNMLGNKDFSENTKKDVIGKLNSFIHSEKSIYMAKNWVETGAIGLSDMPMVVNKPLEPT